MTGLPETQKALVLNSLRDPIDLTLQDVPTPKPTPGSAIVRVLAFGAPKNANLLFSGKAGFPMALPFIPGGGAIVRVAAVGPDAVSLTPGQLAYTDTTVHARDDPTATFLQGAFAFGPAIKLMQGEWRNGAAAEYAKIPLENVIPLDEDVLFNRLGYAPRDLTPLHGMLVAYGGFASIDLKPGESIVIAPATGVVSSIAVIVALGMGARVVAVARDEVKLKQLTEVLNPIYNNRLSYVQLTGDLEKDAQAIQKASPGSKGFDCYYDIPPPQAAQSTHMKACLMALKIKGRASLMGSLREDIGLPYMLVVSKSLRLQGRFMYEPHQVRELIAMIEAGLIKLGAQGGLNVIGGYKLEDAAAAFEAAANYPAFGPKVAIEP